MCKDTNYFLISYKKIPKKNKNLKIKSFKDNIKSHNQMSTFFSGQDVHTLEDNAIDMNRFFSLIVNNVGTYKAAITRKCKVTENVKRTSTYNSFEDKEITSQMDYEREADDVYDAEYVKIAIESPKIDKKNIEFLEMQFKELEKQKEKQFIERQKSTSTRIQFEKPKEKVPYSTMETAISADQYGGNFNKFITHMGNILLTGIMTLDINSPLNIDHWVKDRMCPVFKSRFKDVESQAFKNYAETMLWYIEEEFDEFEDEDSEQLTIDFIEEEDMMDGTISIMYAALYNYLCMIGNNEWIDQLLYEIYSTGYITPILEQQM